MHAAEERRERVEVATWDSEQQLRLFEQLMDLARDEQQHRAKIQRDEIRMHAEMERSEASDVATIKAAMEAMAESARREQEELLRDEKEERYTIQEDERRLRRNITRQSAELSLDVSMQHVQQRGKEDAQRELDMLRVALESTAVETTSRARLNLVVTEELRARDSLCSDEASERAMHAAEERRERVEVATWDSEQQLRLFEQLMDLARDEQQHRAKIQRDEIVCMRKWNEARLAMLQQSRLQWRPWQSQHVESRRNYCVMRRKSGTPSKRMSGGYGAT
ncbi:hypothetical protein DPX39_100164800 [Trypanosoma brucei equiperdum]|uniref:Trichohyalin n=1 Tax=Trypanosoma brucei equiperdum TaxID=630700 RepID=A0A3L6KXP6_9TRYP|nr:hypothetical protein DPX39_100164800 [Trypanosoma brucei equiperdum]